MSPTSPADGPTVTRRRLLKAVGAAAAMGGLAGCGRAETYAFEATPAGLSENGVEAFEYGPADHEEFVEEPEPSVAGVEDVTVTSHLVAYGVDPADRPPTDWSVDDPGGHSVGVLSTPEASVIGEPHNRLATASLSEVVTGPLGREFLRDAGAGGGGPVSFVRELERVSVRDGAVLFGGATTVESYLGVTDGGDDPDAAVLVHVARTAVGGDAVLVAAVQRRRLPTDVDPREVPLVGSDGLVTEDTLDDLLAFPGVVLLFVEHHPPIGVEIPSVGLRGVGLVQTVADTHVEGTDHVEPDPDLVADQYGAVVFDVTERFVENLDPESTVRVQVVRTDEGGVTESDRFYLDVADVLDVASGRVSAVRRLHDNAREGGIRAPAVFTVRPDLAEVEVTVGYGDTDVAGDAVTLVAGEDFVVRELPPLRVGFATVEDPGGGDNYGDRDDGLATRFESSVEAAVEFLQVAYPGDLVAYREDGLPRIVGHDQTGPKDGCDAALDYQNALSITIGARSDPEFPAGGTLWTTLSSEERAAEYVRSNGFNLTVLVVPGDDRGTNRSYFEYHYGADYGGYNRKGVPGSAVAVVDWGDEAIGHGEVGVLTGHEILHHLVVEPYRGPAGHPMADRPSDPEVAEETVDGRPVDVDHATRAVLSRGFDLTDGTFTLVEGFAGFGDDLGVFGPEDEEDPWVRSLLSNHRDRARMWPDARAVQGLVDGGFRPPRAPEFDDC